MGGRLVTQGNLGWGDAGGEEALWILAPLIGKRRQLWRLKGRGLVQPWSPALPFPHHHTGGFSPPFPLLLSLGLFTHHTVSFPTFAQAVSTA